MSAFEPVIPYSTSQTRPPRVFVISGPSGVGKDTVIERLLPLIQVDPVVTVTTRQRRENEVNGIHYRFLTLGEFEAMEARGDLLESAFVHGNWYGVPADSVRASLARGHDVLIKVDPQGARSIKRLLPSAVFIFLRPSSLEELRGRLMQRGSENATELALRLHNAEQELQEQVWFDYVVENANGQLEETLAKLCAIMGNTVQIPIH